MRESEPNGAVFVKNNTESEQVGTGGLFVLLFAICIFQGWLVLVAPYFFVGRGAKVAKEI